MAIQQEVAFSSQEAIPARWFSHYGFDAWFWQPTRPPLAGTPRELRRQGWQRLGPDQVVLFDCLSGQLADIRQRSGASSEEYWVLDDDLAFAETYRSGVGFLLPPELLRLLPPHQVLEVSSPYPPPELGQIGLVLHGYQYCEYPATVLPPEMQPTLHQLEATLCALQEGSQEEPLRTYRLICSVPSIMTLYQERLTLLRDTLRTQVPLFYAPLKRVFPTRIFSEPLRDAHFQLQRVEQKLALLDQARQQLETLCRPPTEEERRRQLKRYEELWPQVREQVRRLAVAYSRIGAPRVARAASVPMLRPAGADEEAPLTPDAWLKRQYPRAAVLGDPVSRALLIALRDGAAWVWDAEGGFARFAASLQPPTGTAELELRLAPEKAEPGQVQAQVETWQRLMSDHLLDTWLALQMLLLGLTDEFTTPLEDLSVNHLLAVCLREKSHGSYTPAQRQRVSAELDLLAHLSLLLTIHLPSHSFPVAPILSPLLTSEKEETSQHASITLGDWVRLLPTQWRATVDLPRHLLKLHPEWEWKAKRLGLQLSFLFSDYPRGVTLKMADFLAQSHVPLDAGNNYKRFRDRIMRALKLLAGLPAGAEAGKQRNLDEKLVWDSSRERRGIPPEERSIGDFWEVDRDEEAQRKVRELQDDWYSIWLSLSWHFLPPLFPDSKGPQREASRITTTAGERRRQPAAQRRPGAHVGDDPS